MMRMQVKPKGFLRLMLEKQLKKINDKWTRFLLTASGTKSYQSPEVRELQIMRAGSRNEVYEKFFSDTDGRVLPNKQALPWQDTDDLEEKLERWALPVYVPPEALRTEDGVPLCLTTADEALAFADQDSESE